MNLLLVGVRLFVQPMESRGLMKLLLLVRLEEAQQFYFLYPRQSQFDEFIHFTFRIVL
jgi:hypothetical protein